MKEKHHVDILKDEEKGDDAFFKLTLTPERDRPPREAVISTILPDRGKTHGNAWRQFTLAQRLKADIREAAGEGLDPMEREALDMIMVKVSRIVTGQSRFREHWDDIIGYAELVIRDTIEENNAS